MKINFSRDDLKELAIKQVKTMIPEEMVKINNITATSSAYDGVEVEITAKEGQE